MRLNKRQQLLLEFVQKKHKGQTRKYTGEEYWTHPFAVACIASKYDKRFGIIEGALCHDLIEDTDCTIKELVDTLKSFKYQPYECYTIIRIVNDLTDRFTKKYCPNLNRKERKKCEKWRLSEISEVAQSIKYSDLIHNTISIVGKDINFAKIYLQEKKEILDVMRKGNIDLLIKCCYYLKKGIDETNKNIRKGNN